MNESFKHKNKLNSKIEPMLFLRIAANNFKVYLLALCYFCIFIFCLPKPHQQLSQYNGKKTGRKGLGISNFTRPGLKIRSNRFYEVMKPNLKA